MTAPSPGDALAGLFWSVAYVGIARRGFRDKACGMPLFALCCNFSWEVLGVVNPTSPEAFYPTLAWALIDVIIFYQALKYGRDDVAHPFVKRHFFPILFSTLFYAGALIFLFEKKFLDVMRYYTAFSINLVISSLFIAMLLRRDSSRGQSMYVALSKMLGTLFVFVEIVRLGRQADPLFTGLQAAGIFALDVIYIVMLYRKLRAEGLPVWRRF